jgi:hypothetical protein
MWRSISIFAVVAICLAIPRIGRADEPQTADPFRAPLSMPQRPGFGRPDNPEAELAATLARIDFLKQRIDHLKQRSIEIQAHLQVARDQMSEIQQSIRKTTGLVDVDPETVHRLITTLQEQREQMELEAAGADGRRAALQEAIAKLSKQLDDRAASDQVSVELAKVVDIRETQVKRQKALYDHGNIPQSEVDAAQAALASARAELAAARQKAVSSASGDALDAWNRQLLELTIAAQERAARLKFVVDRLEKCSEVLQALDVAESRRGDVPRFEKEALEAEAGINSLSEEMDKQKMDEQRLRAGQAATTQPAGGAGAGQENR